MAAHDAPRFPTSSWKEALTDRMDDRWSEEIDDFESQIELRKQGRIEDKVFAETRLRRGAYGQRYDCLLYTSPSPRDATLSRMPSSA